jgi:hypothetical protein
MTLTSVCGRRAKPHSILPNELIFCRSISLADGLLTAIFDLSLVKKWTKSRPSFFDEVQFDLKYSGRASPAENLFLPLGSEDVFGQKRTQKKRAQNAQEMVRSPKKLFSLGCIDVEDHFRGHFATGDFMATPGSASEKCMFWSAYFRPPEKAQFGV